MNFQMQSFRSEPWRKAATIFWTVGISFLLLKTAFKPTMHSIYPARAEAVREWWTGAAAEDDENSYDLNRQYTPAFPLLMTPFCVLPDRVGGVLWLGCSLAVFLTGFRRFLSVADPKISAEEAGKALLLLPWCGLASLYNGQTNILASGLLAWSVYAVAARRWNLAAVCLAVPVIVKTYPVAMAMVLVVLYPRQLLGRWLTASTALALAPFLVRPFDVVAERYRLFFEYLTSGEHYTMFRFIGFRDLLARWIIDVPPAQFIPLQMATGLLVLAAVLAGREIYRDERRTLTAVLGLTTMWMVLFGPATEEATFLLAAPFVAWRLVDAARIAPASSLTLGAFVGPLQTSILGEQVRRGVWGWKLAPWAMTILFVGELRVCLAPFASRWKEAVKRPWRTEGRTRTLGQPAAIDGWPSATA